MIKRFIKGFDFDMRPLIRTNTEFFSTTVRNNYNKNVILITNASFYDLTNAGKMDAFYGHDPVSAKETIPIGQIINGTKIVGGGRPSNEGFYIAFWYNTDHMSKSKDVTDAFKTGIGNPPSTCSCAFSGLGPLIINGLPYGTENRYKSGVPSGAPKIGEPPAKFKNYLIQRSSSAFTSFRALDERSGNLLGKNCLGVSPEGIYVYVQEHGDANSVSIEAIRDDFVSKKCKHAVFFDGSDSALFFEKGHFLASQGEDKDETCTIGVIYKKR